MQFIEMAAARMDYYNPKNGLGRAVKNFLFKCQSQGYYQLACHSAITGLLVERITITHGLDPKLVCSAIMHDFGKLYYIDREIVESRDNINDDDYDFVKLHPIIGFERLKERFLFTAICCGLHHKYYRNGYGIEENEIPKNISSETKEMLKQDAKIIAICDYIEAYYSRSTSRKHGAKKGNLVELIMSDIDCDGIFVVTAVKEAKKIFKN